MLSVSIPAAYMYVETCHKTLFMILGESLNVWTVVLLVVANYGEYSKAVRILSEKRATRWKITTLRHAHFSISKTRNINTWVTAEFGSGYYFTYSKISVYKKIEFMPSNGKLAEWARIDTVGTRQHIKVTGQGHQQIITTLWHIWDLPWTS